MTGILIFALVVAFAVLSVALLRWDIKSERASNTKNKSSRRRRKNVRRS